MLTLVLKICDRHVRIANGTYEGLKSKNDH